MPDLGDRAFGTYRPPRPWRDGRYYAIALPRWPSWPWRRLIWTHLLAVSAGVLLATVIYSLVRWDGSALATEASFQQLTVKPGGTTTFTVQVTNLSDTPVRIERAALAEGSSWVRVLGISAADGRPVAGTAIPAQRYTVVSVRIRAHRVRLARGAIESIGVGRLRVWYRSGFGVPLLGKGHWVQTTSENLLLRVVSP